MALVVDAGALFAQADADDPAHRAVRRVLESERELLVTTELAIAEADYLILDRLGVDAETAFLDDVIGGTYVVDCLDRAELIRARELVGRFRDLEIGLADASLVMLAERYRTRRILTVDRRHFGALRAADGTAFEILPTEVRQGD